MQKKTRLPFTQEIHTLAKYLYDWKVVIGIFLVVFFAFIGAFFSAVNYAYNLKSAPLATKVTAIEQRNESIEKTLQSLSDNNARIESKVDKILIKLIPNSSLISRE